MKKAATRAVLFALAFLPFSASAQPNSALNIRHSVLKFVNPFIGTDAHGHTFPGATMPFGAVQLSPDTRPDPNDWDGCSGYHFSDSVIYGFSHTHLSGTGVSDYCDILVQPVVEDSGYGKKDFGSPFLKKNEKAEAGFYSVFLERPKTQVELTASEHVGFHRYSFEKGAKTGRILLDLGWRDEVLEVMMDCSRIKEGIVTGHRFSRSWAKNQRIFFFLKFSKKPITSITSSEFGKPGYKGIFGFSNENDEPLVVECAISGVDVAGAEKNWQAETTNFDFEKAKKRAQETWQKQLSKIEIDLGRDAIHRVSDGYADGRDEKNIGSNTEPNADRDAINRVSTATIFYTALYHTMLAPNVWSDVDGRYRGRDDRIHFEKNHRIYTVFSLWDTYRALHPLMTILEPERVGDWMVTFLRQFKQGGRLPVWELAANETDCMIGNHAIPVIADAYLKGLVADSLAERLFEAMKTSATDGTRGLDLYEKWGYIPSDLEPESVSKTLEYSFDDYCISKMAEKMGRKSDADFFALRSESWKNLLDPETGFFRAKRNAAFVEPFEPGEVNFNYTEGNAWQYAFLQHHDEEQRKLLPKYKAQLDSLFQSKKPVTGRIQADLTGLMGQFVIGNEPDMHTPFLWNRFFREDKTTNLVETILKMHFSDRPDGLPGNDDCGQMSAWVVFSNLGFYPTQPIGGEYAWFKPSFSHIKIHLANEKTAELNGIYTQEDQERINRKSKNSTGPDVFLLHKHLMLGYPGPSIRAMKAEKMQQVAVPFLNNASRVFVDSISIQLQHCQKKSVIYYSLDGSEPTENSLIFDGDESFSIKNSCVLKAVAIKNGKKSKTIEAHFTRQEDRRDWRVSYKNTFFDNQYTGGGERGLIDGLAGGADFRSGGWQGFQGQNLEIVVDLGKKRDLSRLAMTFLQDENSWIFLPLRVDFLISDDGSTWDNRGSAFPRKPKEATGQFQELFELKMEKPQAARYLKIRAEALEKCPDWHKGRGEKCWIFADEITVE